MGKLKEALSGADELEENLKKVQNEQELKSWCDDVSIQPFGSDKDIRTQGVQKFCVLYIRDQILGSNNKLLEASDSWQEANERLKGPNKDKLSQDMEKIKVELENKKEDALKDWCVSRYDLPFKDKRDPLLIDVSKFCTVSKIKKAPSPSAPNLGGPRG